MLEHTVCIRSSSYRSMFRTLVGMLEPLKKLNELVKQCQFRTLVGMLELFLLPSPFLHVGGFEPL